MKIQDVQPRQLLQGLEPYSLPTVAAVAPIGDSAFQVFYRTGDGVVKERLLSAADEVKLGCNNTAVSIFGQEFNVAHV